MLSLVEQLHNFLAEWQANQEMAGRPECAEGTCSLCGRERYVHYDIQLDVMFCSPRCAWRYEQMQKAKTYAG